MLQYLLKQQLEVSARQALCSGEMERAEHLYASLTRSERKHIDALLRKSLAHLAHNPCSIRDDGYIQRSYLITAIVSTYKAARFIEGRIRNLLDQSIANQLEILVIDSSSPQNEGDIVRIFQQQYSNIRYLRTDRRESVYQAWNRGVAAASGRYLTNANTDDRLRHDALEQMVAALERGADVAYADSILTTGENETFSANSAYTALHRPPFSRNALLESCITGSHPAWRKSIHDTIGFFDISYSSAGDYDFFIRASGDFTFVHIPETLGLVWTSPETFSGRGLLPNMEFYAIRERYHKLLVPTGNYGSISPEHGEVLSRIKMLASERTNQNIDDLLQDDPYLCHEFGVFCEQNDYSANAWRYLQRAYYLDPGNQICRTSMERVLKASLSSSIMELSGSNDFLQSPDMLATVAHAALLLNCPNVALWCYAIALEHDPAHAAIVAGLDKLVTKMYEGVIR